MVDVGHGMNQILPILASHFFRASTDMLEVVEQPKLHLHPAAHGEVAELYIAAIQNSRQKFIVETHSDNFILRIQRRIAEGKLKPEANPF